MNSARARSTTSFVIEWSIIPRKLLPLKEGYCYLDAVPVSLAYSVQDNRPMSSLKRWTGPTAFFVCCSVSCFFFATISRATTISLPQIPQPAAQGQVQQSREPAPAIRIPRQQAFNTTALDGVVRSTPAGAASTLVPGARLTLRNLQTGQLAQCTTNVQCTTNGEGLFRIFPLLPGHYELRVEATGYAAFVLADLALQPNEVVTLEISLNSTQTAEERSRLPRLPELGPPPPAMRESTTGSYREFRHRLDSDPAYIQELAPDYLPPVADVYNAVPNRWALSQPDYRRYTKKGEYLYTRSRWFDPFNRNRFKGDQPIWPALLGQQTFLNVTASAESFFDGRRVPSPSNVSTARTRQQRILRRRRTSFLRSDLPLHLRSISRRRIFQAGRLAHSHHSRTQPQQSQRPRTRHRQPRRSRRHQPLRHPLGLQEAFVEDKLADLSPNYDFVSVRAGIQQFNADFRGFLFVDEQPAVRIFGNLHSDRIEYNAAYFNFLEKNTNSGLNSTFAPPPSASRSRRMFISRTSSSPATPPNLSARWNKDDGVVHYDDNGFLVRPAPIGNVINQNPGAGPISHGIRLGYFGWLGSGHIRRVNLTHAFYQAVGEDTLIPSPVAQSHQRATRRGEFSYDRDWIRYRVSTFYTSGDANPRKRRARGFDSIVELPNFAGGLFSFWNREGIRLTGSAAPAHFSWQFDSRPARGKEERPGHFHEAGIFLANAGADFDITPKLKGFANVNFLRFERTKALEDLLFQSPIRHTIGTDFLAVEYRPPLSENIVLTGGASLCSPVRACKEIYWKKRSFPVPEL